MRPRCRLVFEKTATWLATGHPQLGKQGRQHVLFAAGQGQRAGRQATLQRSHRIRGFAFRVVHRRFLELRHALSKTQAGAGSQETERRRQLRGSELPRSSS